MRITGGTHRGRRLDGVPPGVRPTPARVREALFSILGELEGRSFLDATGGSGLVALEAASRGARVTVIERSPRALRAIARQAERLGLADRLQLRRADALRWKGPPHELVFADPPYAEEPAPWVAALLPLAREVFVLEHAARVAVPPGPAGPPELRRYGDTALAFYWLSR